MGLTYFLHTYFYNMSARKKQKNVESEMKLIKGFSLEYIKSQFARLLETFGDAWRES